MKRWITLVLAVLLLAAMGPSTLAEGLEIEEEPVALEVEEIGFAEDDISGDAVDNAVEEEDFMIFSDAPVEKGYAEFLTEEEENLTEVPVDEAHFPDAIFRDYVAFYFDNNNDGVLSKSEIKGAVIVDIAGDDGYNLLSSVKGIEYLTYLKGITCKSTNLTGLDLSKNTDLYNLDLPDNSLTDLDVSKNTKLEMLDCSGNSLKSLDLSKNPALRELICDDNRLTNLDVSKFAALETLSCRGNQLKRLDLSKNPALTYLSCGKTGLTSLDLSKNPQLEEVYCEENQLKSLDLHECTRLKILSCNDNQLSSLDVGECPALESLDFYNNQMVHFITGKNTSLNWLDGSNNQLTSLDLGGCTALTFLECDHNQLASLDVTGCTALYSLDCSGNQLTNLCLNGCALLMQLECDDNHLTNLELNHCPDLYHFSCSNNQLTSVDIRNNGGLVGFYCDNNRLTDLDLSKNQSLRRLEIQHNEISALDFTTCTQMISLLSEYPWVTKREHGKVVRVCVDDSDSSPLLVFDYSTRLTIKGKNIIGLVDATAKNKTYTGKALKPTVTVKHGSKTLVKGTDYTVSYEENIKVGLGYAKIKGKGNYTGTKEIPFKINPKGVTKLAVKAGKKKLTVTWKAQKKQVDGYEIQYATKKDFSNAKKKAISGAKKDNLTIKGLKAKKTYFVRIRAYTYCPDLGKNLYSSWSKAKKIKTK